MTTLRLTVRLLAGVGTFAAVVLAIAAPFTWPHGVRFALGIWPVPAGTGWPYQLESGFLPALTVLTLLTFLTGAWHRVNCHEPRCPRIGKHVVNGTSSCYQPANPVECMRARRVCEPATSRLAGGCSSR